MKIQCGIAVLATPMVALAMLALGMASGRAADALSGSGVVIGEHGEVLTNAHVVNAGAQIHVRSAAGDSATAQLIARDEKNDLAVIRSTTWRRVEGRRCYRAVLER
jgi:S1-C subfamily serine protease